MSGAGDPIDDEDAFLYGTSNTEITPSHDAALSVEPSSESLARPADTGLETARPDSSAAAGIEEVSAPEGKPEDVEEEEEEDSDESVRILL